MSSLVVPAGLLVFYGLALTSSIRRLKGHSRARTRVIMAHAALLLAALVPFVGYFVERDYYQHLARHHVSSLNAFHDPQASEDERQRAEESRRDEKHNHIRELAQELRTIWMQSLNAVAVTLDTLALILLIAAAFADRETVVLRNDEKPSRVRRLLPHMIKVLFGIVALALAALWAWYLTSRDSFVWFTQLTTYLMDGLPYLASVMWAFGVVLFSRQLPPAARQYGLFGVSLAVLGIAINAAFIVITFVVNDPRENPNLSIWLTAQQHTSLLIFIAAYVFLLSAVLVERKSRPAVAPTTRLRLEDPLFELRRVIRRFAWSMAAIVTVVAIAFSVWKWNAEITLIAMAVAVGVSFALLINAVMMTFMMPSRAPNVIYLRSFRNDQRSYPIRIALQESLGEKFRVTGIRDPSRRAASVWDYLIGPTLWAFRYCTPKYMDLEAGEDWQARLWNTLLAARMAVVDLRDMTRFVHVEIKLSFQALGWRRVVFVVDESRTLGEWRDIIRTQVNSDGGQHIQIVYWNPESSDEFRKEMRRLALGLPQGAVEHRVPPGEFGCLHHIPWIERRAIGFCFVFAVLQCAMAVLVYACQELLGHGARMTESEKSAVVSPVTWWQIAATAWVQVNLLRYAWEVGVSYERRKALMAFGVILTFDVAILVVRAILR